MSLSAPPASHNWLIMTSNAITDKSYCYLVATFNGVENFKTGAAIPHQKILNTFEHGGRSFSMVDSWNSSLFDGWKKYGTEWKRVSNNPSNDVSTKGLSVWVLDLSKSNNYRMFIKFRDGIHTWS